MLRLYIEKDIVTFLFAATKQTRLAIMNISETQFKEGLILARFECTVLHCGEITPQVSETTGPSHAEVMLVAGLLLLLYSDQDPVMPPTVGVCLPTSNNIEVCLLDRFYFLSREQY